MCHRRGLILLPVFRHHYIKKTKLELLTIKHQYNTDSGSKNIIGQTMWF